MLARNARSKQARAAAGSSAAELELESAPAARRVRPAENARRVAMRTSDHLGFSRVRLNIRQQPLFNALGVFRWEEKYCGPTKDEPTREDAIPRVRRVALFVERKQPNTNANWIVKPIAKIGFGAGSVHNFIEVDWKTGVQVSFAATEVDVAVVLIERVNAEQIASIDELVTFGACIVEGGDGLGPRLVTRTTEQHILPAPGTSPAIPIPPYAYAVEIVSPTWEDLYSVGAAAALRFSGSGDGGGAIIQNQVLVDPATSAALRGPYTIPGGAASVMLAQAGGPPIISFELVFHIGA